MTGKISLKTYGQQQQKSQKLDIVVLDHTAWIPIPNLDFFCYKTERISRKERRYFGIPEGKKNRGRIKWKRQANMKSLILADQGNLMHQHPLPLPATG